MPRKGLLTLNLYHEHRSKMRVVSRNKFARVYGVKLPPGTVGVDVKFRSESKDSGRVEVAAVRGAVAEAGVVAGDILVAFGGYALPSRASAMELEELMKEQEKMNQSVAVDVLMWRNEYKFVREKGGDEVLIAFGKHDRSRDVVWALVDETSFAIAKGPSPSFEQGLVLIGINHEPVRDDITEAELAKCLQQRQKTSTGPLVLQCWRHGDRKTHAQIVKRCQQACLGPSQKSRTKTAMKKPASKSSSQSSSTWGSGRFCPTTTCCCCASPTPPTAVATSPKFTTIC